MAAFPESSIDPCVLQASTQTHPGKCAGIHLLWQHRGVGSAVRKMVCFLTPCINTSGCHGPVLASKGVADLPELVCVSSQCGRPGTVGGCVALPLQLCSHSPQQT